ncbi:TetR/AcrR family transcriptional regulator [Tumebacillus sp. DT12]|uniref:TetR/AcrR family transcriptional regulator n=1 Tax=Tumebacillus lacus TaxID=2995335 RepID=A0ABT3X4V1_9BACL|nr:TetR/AcrR family transcriptional regulator [Tumebacillus lacus]
MFRAALAEFVEYGYDLASTNRIVEQAGISKGVLFKYFSNKEGLFRYVCERGAQEMERAFDLAPEELPDDFFEALKVLAWREIEFSQGEPEIYRFFQRIAENMAHPVHQGVIATIASSTQGLYLSIMSRLNVSQLRPDVPYETILHYFKWVMEGAKKHLFAVEPPPRDVTLLRAYQERAMEQFDVYFELVKHGIYRR